METYAGIEAGGTKFNCLVGSGPEDIRAEQRFATTTPRETLGEVIGFLEEQASQATLVAVGVGSFGPLDLEPTSPTFGSITTTPKPGWANTDVIGILEKALRVPVALDTDVNAAALGEFRWGSARGLDPLIYLTIGTGIGGGGIYNGRPMHGLVHPEMGHMRLPHDRQLDPFPGSCPYHGDCFEGLASGPAIMYRWGTAAEALPDDHPAWDLEAYYLALAVSNLVCCFSPRRVVVGGGVMQRPHLLPLVRRKIMAFLNGYIHSSQLVQHIEVYLSPPGLGSRSGVLGAIALAQEIAGRGLID